MASGSSIGRRWDAAKCFLTTGVVELGDAVRLDQLALRALRRQSLPDLVCIALGYG
ncbi:MAG TPA: hypothetical protein VFS39_03375 [Nitrospira sp.]|nr:hypothetical protein [Nitrospira sp.]